MSEDKRKTLQRVILENLTFYDAPISEMKVKLYADDLMDLDAAAVQAAYVHFRKDRTRTKMPMPGEVRNFISPQTDSREEATRLANGILSSLVVHGWTWPNGYTGGGREYWEAVVDGKRILCDSFIQAVGKELGPCAMETIRLLGGWEALHEEWAAAKEHGTMRAQMRDLAQTVIERQRHSANVKAIGLKSVPKIEEET